MSVKMKGLFKGLRYISHIFEEEKEEEIQIGLPTDVKHVAHIGWDGPSANDSAPSWLDNFKSANAFQSAPLGSPGGDPREEPEIKWVSEDSKRSSRAPTSPRSDLPDLPKSSRRHSSTENTDSPRKKEKLRQSRRSKDSSDGSVRSSRRNKEANEAAGSSGSGLPDIPKKSRRKKSKDSFSNEGSSRSRSKGGASSSDPFSDLGNDSGPIPRAQGSQLSPVMERND